MKTMKNSRQRGVLALLGWAMAGAFLTLGVCSCGGGKSSEENPFAFAQVETLTCDSIPIAEILHPSAWTVEGDKAVLASRQNDSLFWVYRLPEFEFLYCFGLKGEGPYELTGISLMRDASQQGRFCVGDQEKELSYRLDETEAKDVRRIPLGGVSNPMMRVGDSIALGQRMLFSMEEVRYEYYTVNTRSGQGVDTVRALLSKASLQLSERGMAVANLHNVPKVALLGEGFVLAYPDVRSLYFYRVDQAGKIDLERVVGEQLTREQVEALPQERFETGYGLFQAQGTDERIYLLSYRRGDRSGEENKAAFTYYVEVYDKRGRPIKTFELDRAVTSMLVDEQRGRFYFYDARYDFEWVYTCAFDL